MVLLKLSKLNFNILLVLVTTFASCNSKSKKIVSDEMVITSNSEIKNNKADDLIQPDLFDIEEPGTTRNDSIYISGNYILFYGPSEQDIVNRKYPNNTSEGIEQRTQRWKRVLRNYSPVPNGAR